MRFVFQEVFENEPQNLDTTVQTEGHSFSYLLAVNKKEQQGW